jgi:hypothetical protein
VNIILKLLIQFLTFLTTYFFEGILIDEYGKKEIEL